MSGDFVNLNSGPGNVKKHTHTGFKQTRRKKGRKQLTTGEVSNSTHLLPKNNQPHRVGAIGKTGNFSKNEILLDTLLQLHQAMPGLQVEATEKGMRALHEPAPRMCCCRHRSVHWHFIERLPFYFTGKHRSSCKNRKRESISEETAAESQIYGTLI